MISKLTSQPIGIISDSPQKVLTNDSVDRNQKIKNQFKEVSDLYEKQFLREMMKSMRTTVTDGGLIKKNQAEKIFSEQLDNEYVEKWGAKGGIGLSELIYNNMMERFGEKLGLKEPVNKPTGPLNLKENDTYHIKNSSGSNASQYFLKDIKTMDSKPVGVQQPWSGYIAKKLQLAPDEYFLEINHTNGLTSQMHFKGNLLKLNENELIEQGQELGYLSPDANSFSVKIISGLKKMTLEKNNF